MKLEFAKYYDITEVAQEHNSQYNEYSKIWICIDTWDIWICRLINGVRDDHEEGYVPDEDSMILERNKIAKDFKGQGIDDHNELLAFLDKDDFGNWDCQNCDSEEEAIEMVDDGYGIEQYKK